MKVAIVHEWLTIYGGSERVTEIFHEIFPEAPIYCLVYDEKTMPERFKNYDIRPTFVQKLPFAKKKYKAYLPIMPRAYEELDLTEYDLVISSSTACAKGVITRSDAIHICYCHTPTRYLWEFYYEYVKGMGKLKKIIISMFIHKLRIWDRLSADRVDNFIANSNYIASRISKYYRREAKVIFPPVNTHLYNINNVDEKYYLIVSRLVAYKKVDLAIEAFNKLKLPLIIVGDGPEAEKLKKKSNDNIKFLGRLSDGEIRDYYSKCTAFIFPGEEDFGITPVEAQASGAPVIAYGKGGALDTVINNKSGIFFYEQTVDSLINAIEKLQSSGVEWSKSEIKHHSEKFSVDRFKIEFIEYIKEIIPNLNKNIYD
ncbi:glycosyltransferase [Clostridium butyricum]|uniref:glycosyltransferase n=1 Tax=Clostridium butyricum TaxID=1492 RepID=UPI0005C241AD|nr:glycosyltransferase [Clostridium butyricum]KIU06558.1 group 1 glycosyl transferase [Clostridium butyricum]MBA8966398.1 glycosyltransferase involved in cell wall biosynthesis [Clostridium butyricum]MBA8972538.1 glycosyltransferase involved in cell wall biosynthesis [Clostridium butyricum]MBC2428451.1 glycosyltransferase family 4 protein [Clostridium butyricum]NOW35599.1 glycosyltransferase involved in cell wall biosynthesis [Clostridium butyricum]